MANYYMYYEKLTDVQKWKEYQENKKITKRNKTNKEQDIELDQNRPKECIPIKFNKNGVITDKLNLEDIDYLTSRFKDQEEFFNAIRKQSTYDYLFQDGTNKNFIIVYKHKGEYRKHDIIYNNSLLESCAFEVKGEKNKGKNESEIVLSNTEELRKLISRIKEYAIKNTDGFMESKLVSYNLKQTLDEYVNLKQNDTYLSSEEYEYLNAIESKIVKNVRNYKTLRKLVVWEQKYEKKNRKLEEEYHQQELDILFNNKDRTNEISSYEKEISSMLEGEENELMKWYKLGLQENNGNKSAALDMVFRNVTDLYSYPKEELEKIGILTSKEKRK